MSRNARLLSLLVFLAAFPLQRASARAVRQTEGRFANHSPVAVTKLEITGHCLWQRPAQPVEPCGDAVASLSWSDPGHFTMHAFQIPERHPVFGGSASFVLRARVYLESGRVIEAELPEKARPEDMIRNLSLWGLRAADLRFVLPDGSPAGAFFRSLPGKAANVEVKVAQKRSGAVMAYSFQTVAADTAAFPPEDKAFPFGGYRFVGWGDPEDTQVVFSFRVWEGEKVYFAKTVETGFSPYLVRDLVGPVVTIQAR